MNDDINTLAWSPIARDFAEIFSEDSERRQRLKDCTPADQQSGVYNNHAGGEL